MLTDTKSSDQSRLLVKFKGNQKLYMDFQLWGVVSTPTLSLFKGQLYLPCSLSVPSPMSSITKHSLQIID